MARITKLQRASTINGEEGTSRPLGNDTTLGHRFHLTCSRRNTGGTRRGFCIDQIIRIKAF